MSRKELILGAVDDLVQDFLYYDRKEDEDLPLGEIQDAIYSWEMDVSDITTRFQDSLLSGIKNDG